MRRLPKKPAGRCDCLNTGKTGSEIMSGDDITSRPLCRRRTHRCTQLFSSPLPNLTSLFDPLSLLNATDRSIRVCMRRISCITRRNEIMKFKLLGLALIATFGTGTVFAQNGYGWRDRRDLRHDYADRNADRRDIRRDEARIAHDRRELREDLREGNYRGAEHERAELNREYRDINQDRADIYRDNRDIRHDRNDYRWRY